MRSNGSGNSQWRPDSLDPILVAQQRPVWEVVKEYIEDQIVLGVYPVGSLLPSVRGLSAQMGLNRNTISKAYQALGRDGTVVSKRGVGVLVTLRPSVNRKPSERLASLLVTLVEEAKRSGVSDEALVQRVEAEIARVSQAQHVKIALIECSPQDTEKMCQHLSRHLEVQVDPVDLNDFLMHTESYAEAYDVLSTTFFHLQEVTAAVTDYDVEVVGLHHVPSHESILELARLPSSMIIGLICTNDRTVEKVSTVIRMYTRCAIVPCTVDNEVALQQVLGQANILVDTVQAHDVVAYRADNFPFITLDFQTEPQSIEYLKTRISEESFRRRVTISMA
ncbi:hypothetical protein BH24CHL1_BH24CHL1_16890 [soil metagenome]